MDRIDQKADTIALHRDDRLVVVNLHDEPAKEPRILCSLGLKSCLQTAITPLSFPHA
ncbi:MAG: hypothetical protein NTW21_43070 [Verrucomicrobia bacterium]|nr:hypothetical protein [Verrucomicrobiota bacterium]